MTLQEIYYFLILIFIVLWFKFQILPSIKRNRHHTVAVPGILEKRPRTTYNKEIITRFIENCEEDLAVVKELQKPYASLEEISFERIIQDQPVLYDVIKHLTSYLYQEVRTKDSLAKVQEMISGNFHVNHTSLYEFNNLEQQILDTLTDLETDLSKRNLFLEHEIQITDLLQDIDSYTTKCQEITKKSVFKDLRNLKPLTRLEFQMIDTTTRSLVNSEVGFPGLNSKFHTFYQILVELFSEQNRELLKQIQSYKKIKKEQSDINHKKTEILIPRLKVYLQGVTKLEEVIGLCITENKDILRNNLNSFT